ncbi:unnamed protein product [Schistocephalus solidus]|uniref:Uncharacterized protein n=1 Tax=Schistocephalus solidus TaxID=70667 RepID=A0A3P7DLA2_SCHSO|nr:unnamed protein product [Schistocephalus solidus]
MKAKYENKVPTNRKTWWDKSWREADKAFLLNAEERLKKFGRIQVFPEKPVLSIEEEAPSTEQQQQQQRMETRHAGRHSSQTSVVSTEDATTPKPATKVRTSLDKPKKTKASEDRELDLEIHRLIASPAPYRFQPVCPVCEVFSSAPGQMLKCKGVCGQIMHPHCMRYKEPPPAETVAWKAGNLTLTPDHAAGPVYVLFVLSG